VILRKKLWALAAVPATITAILLATLVGLPGGRANATAFTATFTAVEDTFVRETNPDRNYGRHSKLQVDESPNIKRTLIRFSVTGFPEGATVTSATLRLFVVNHSRTGGTVHTVEAAWSEATTTWSNAPAVGAKEAEIAGPALVGNWVEADVTSAITSNGGPSPRKPSVVISPCLKVKYSVAATTPSELRGTSENQFGFSQLQA